MAKKVKGCVHLVVRKGKVVNVFTHLSDFPKGDGVIHLEGGRIFTIAEFKKSHKSDWDALKKKGKTVIISDY
jgi:hypothetical protein